jgi:uncharacterized protein YjbI with pentapeptide repeats
MRSRIGVGRNRGKIALGLFLVSIILVGLAVSGPVSHYFTGYRAHWREWAAVAAVIIASAGVLVIFRRPRQNAEPRLVTISRFGQAAGISPPGPDGEHTSSRPPRDWVAITASSLPGLAAVVALIFTALTVQATKGQLQATQQQLTVTELGQITDRYNAAVTNLGSSSVDIRLGGIYALQHVMQDDPLYQPTVVAVLCAFARGQIVPGSAPLPDIQAALTVVGTRSSGNDGSTTVVDLDHAQLAGAQLESVYFAGADVADARLPGADLDNADLTGANLSGANLSGAELDAARLHRANLTCADLTLASPTGADLSGADLSGANLTATILADVSLKGASFSGANLTGAILAGDDASGVYFATAVLTGADLSGANLAQAYFVAAQIVGGKFVNAALQGADFTGADLASADLRYADLTDANLSYADLNRANGYAANLTGADLADANLAGADLNGYAANLSGANLTSANLTGANLTDANLTDATLRGAALTRANLTGADWPHGLTPPPGWQRKPGSDRLQPAGRS